jgi:hypothetical protein
MRIRPNTWSRNGAREWGEDLRLHVPFVRRGMQRRLFHVGVEIAGSYPFEAGRCGAPAGRPWGLGGTLAAVLCKEEATKGMHELHHARKGLHREGAGHGSLCMPGKDDVDTLGLECFGQCHRHGLKNAFGVGVGHQSTEAPFRL